MLFSRLNRDMLTPAFRPMGSNLFGALRLGGVGHPVSHDRVDDLQSLSRQRLERLAVRHAPLPAPRVVVAPSPLCPVRQLHENMSRFFSLLLPWRDAVTEEIEVPDWRLRGAKPQYDASLS